MTKYVGRRLVQALLTLILITLIVFFMMRLLPGDPVLIYMGQRAEMYDMSEEALEELRREFGLDKPIWVQYATGWRVPCGWSWAHQSFTGKMWAH